jgi:hypothetical protein
MNHTTNVAIKVTKNGTRTHTHGAYEYRLDKNRKLFL